MLYVILRHAIKLLLIIDSHFSIKEIVLNFLNKCSLIFLWTLQATYSKALFSWAEDVNISFHPPISRLKNVSFCLEFTSKNIFLTLNFHVFDISLFQRSVDTICAFDIVGQRIYEVVMNRNGRIVSLDTLKILDKSTQIYPENLSNIVSLNEDRNWNVIDLCFFMLFLYAC